MQLLKSELIVCEPMKGSEKTIPFLRRLTEMVSDNEGTIFFVPGDRIRSIPARIVVHDRNRMENEILPRFFNHSSFASLRRQLNYFAFSRVGKGKEKGAVYINDQVFEISDILRLKRRLAIATDETVFKASAFKNNTIENVVSASPSTRRTELKGPVKKKSVKKFQEMSQGIDTFTPVHFSKSCTDTVSSSSSSSSSSASPESPVSIGASYKTTHLCYPSQSTMDSVNGKVILDLTQPIDDDRKIFNRHPVAISRDTSFNIPHALGEDDILVGCSALLSLGWQA